MLPQGGPQQQPGAGAQAVAGGGRPLARPDDSGRQLVGKCRELLPLLREKWRLAMAEGGAALGGAGDRGQSGHSPFPTHLEELLSAMDQLEAMLR